MGGGFICNIRVLLSHLSTGIFFIVFSLKTNKNFQQAANYLFSGGFSEGL